MYNLQVISLSDDSNYKDDDIWNNFVDWAVSTYGAENVNEALEEFGGINIMGTSYIGFETEEEAMIFKIRFS